MIYARSRPLVALTFGSLLGSAVLAAEQPSTATDRLPGTEEQFSTTIRGSENPDAIPYAEAMKHFDAGLVYKTDPRAAVRMLKTHLGEGLDIATADEFLRRLNQALEVFYASSKDIVGEMCPRRRELVTVDQVYDWIYKIEAAQNTKLARDIQDAQSVLGDAYKTRLERYINNDLKKSMSMMNIDHKKVTEFRGESAAGVMARMCDRRPSVATK